jgi:hypothetical protein
MFLSPERASVVGGPPESQIDDFQRNHGFRHDALEHIEPTRPSVEQATFDEQRMKKDGERSRPGSNP